MTTTEARQMIAQTPIPQTNPQTWADIGYGDGTFALALAELLPRGSKIIAIDQRPQNLPRIAGNEVQISFRQGDMEKDLGLEEVDGVLLANVLHYSQNPFRIIERLNRKMTTAGQFIVIEYDTNKANPWIPYPIPQQTLCGFFEKMSGKVKLLSRKKSRYNPSDLYAVYMAV